MKELKVHYTSDLVPFSYNSQENLERSEAEVLPVGKILSSHADLAFMARGTSLEVIYTSNGTRRSACNLGNGKDNVKIQCVCEFFVEDNRKLLIGLDVVGRKRNGILCVYDLAVSRVTRAIFVPEPVTFIHVLHVESESQSVLAKLSDAEHSQPLIVIGCKGGQTLIIRIGEIKSYHQRNDLSFPADLNFIKVEDLIKMEDDELDARTNYAIDLSVEFYSDASFRYLDAAGKPIRVFKRGDVSVTSLLHIKQAALLIVGYSFGCFQIWDLQSLQMIFSSSLDTPLADITHLALQEPENDPRHCCYLIVGRSPSPNKKINLPTTVTLYQLVFEFKDIIPGNPSVYRELEAVCKRFEHQLTSDAYHLADSRSLGSRLIAFSALPRLLKQPKHDQTADSSFDSAKYLDTTLAYIVWESPPQDQELHPSFHLGLFDINRWYHLQMPSSIREAIYGSKDPVCPFFAFYSLSEVGEVILPDTLVDAYIDTKDINGFSCPSYPSHEQNFWPSSLAFKCTCLAERGLVKTEMLGMQRQILADMVSKGSEAFTNTYQLFNLCWSAGLMPKVLDVSRLGDQKVQFECLMSVAIEHNASSFVMTCVQDWSTGEITNSGSCLRSVLQWAWKRVTKAKGLLDRYYISLFYSENSSLDIEVSRDLNQCVDEMTKLVQVLAALKDSPVSISDEGSASLSVKLTVARRLLRYAQAILFLVRSGLLPESSETNGPASKLKDQICNYLLNVYSERREAIQDFSSSIDGDVLFIDDFCKEITEKINDHDDDNDDEFGWDGKYPPPSVNAVCRCLLLDVPSDNVTNFLLYWLLDVAEHLKMDKLVENAVCYFNISKQKRQVTEAVWEIDRKNFESGIEKLIEHAPELLPNAMKIIYYYGKKSLACSVWKAKEMLSSVDHDAKLSIKILLENRFLHEAYKLQERYRDTAIGFDLYQYFLEECMKNNLMPKFFDLHFTEEEESILFQFLEKHSSQIAKDLLVVLCIKRHRYAEAIRYGGKMTLDRKTIGSQTIFGNITSRKAIMDMTEHIIPPIQRKLVSFPSQFRTRENRQIREVARPEPLSAAIVKRGGRNMTSHSETIFKVIHSVEVNRSLTELEEDEEASFYLPFVRSAMKSMSAGRKRRDLIRPRHQEESDTPKTVVEDILKTSITETIASSIPPKRRKHLHYGAEAMQLLKTPPVIKNPLHFKQLRNQRTPASILKSRINLDKTETTGKSIRKRVVIADPNSPVDTPESPSFLGRCSFDLKTQSALPKLDFTESPSILAEETHPTLPQQSETIEISDLHKQTQSEDEESTPEIVELQQRNEEDTSTVITEARIPAESQIAAETQTSNKSDVIKLSDSHAKADLDGSSFTQQGKDDIIRADESNNESHLDVVSGLLTADASLQPTMPSLASEIIDAEKTEEPVIQVEDMENTHHGLGAPLIEDSDIHENEDAASSRGLLTYRSDEIANADVSAGSGDEFILQLSDNEAEILIDGHREEAKIENEGPLSQDDAHSDREAEPGKQTKHFVKAETRTETEIQKEAEIQKETDMHREADLDSEANDQISDPGLESEVPDDVKTEVEVETEDQTGDSEAKNENEAPEGLHNLKVETDIKADDDDAETKIGENEAGDVFEMKTESKEEPVEIDKEHLLEKEVKIEKDVDEMVSDAIVQQGKESIAEAEKEFDEERKAGTPLLEKEAERTENDTVEHEQEAQEHEQEDEEHEKEVGEHETEAEESLTRQRSSHDFTTLDTPVINEQSEGERGSSKAFVTPDFFTLPSMRNSDIDSGSAVEELMKKGRGDLKIFVDRTDLTPSMIDYDTSFESPGSSFAFTPSDVLETPDRSVFDTIVEKEATPPKQAKMSSKLRKSTTRSKNTTKQQETNVVLKSPKKSGKTSLSPSKPKRRSFHTPKISQNEALYSRPVTRSSARKSQVIGESKALLQEIGESNQFKDQFISESAISFVPASDTKKKERRKSLRRSLQSPRVANVSSPHTMTLRNRSKIVTPERFL